MPQIWQLVTLEGSVSTKINVAVYNPLEIIVNKFNWSAPFLHRTEQASLIYIGLRKRSFGFKRLNYGSRSREKNWTVKKRIIKVHIGECTTNCGNTVSFCIFH